MRGLRVVEHDALLAVEPAVALVHLGDNGIDPEGRNAVAQRSMHGVEGLALPAEEADEFGNFRGKHRSGRDDGGALSFATGNVAGRTAAEKIVQLLLGHRSAIEPRYKS